MAQLILYQSFDPPKFSMLIPKMFLKIETATTTAVTDVVAVYYIKTA